MHVAITVVFDVVVYCFSSPSVFHMMDFGLCMICDSTSHSDRPLAKSRYISKNDSLPVTVNRQITVEELIDP